MPVPPSKVAPLPTRVAGRPLQVYLDSSDYSILSEAMQQAQHPHAATFRALCGYVDEGRIEIRFSSIHVVEAAHLNPESRDLAIGRARCIQRLSGGKCFRFSPDLPLLEGLERLSRGRVRESVTSDIGFWHPDFSELALTLRQSIVDGIRKILVEKELNRHRRRAVERQLFPNGRLSAKVVRGLQVGRQELLSELSRQFPLSERFFTEDLMLKFAAGDVPAQEIVEELCIVFRDLEKFIGWTFDTRDTDRKSVAWLRDHGYGLVSKIEGLREKFDIPGLRQQAPVMFDREMQKRLEAKVPELREMWLDHVKDTLEKRYPRIKVAPGSWEEFKAEPSSSMDALIGVFLEYWKRHLRMSRKPIPSDGADLLHLLHLPYCDIFRADGDTAQTAKPLASIHGTIVVPKLGQLLTQLEASLKARAAADAARAIGS